MHAELTSVARSSTARPHCSGDRQVSLLRLMHHDGKAVVSQFRIGRRADKEWLLVELAHSTVFPMDLHEVCGSVYRRKVSSSSFISVQGTKHSRTTGIFGILFKPQDWVSVDIASLNCGNAGCVTSDHAGPLCLIAVDAQWF
jgi:hypothetical protein